jgi:hypothetical protein
VSAIDRGVRRVAGMLEEDEALLAAVLGLEPGGRRRRVVVASDRRLVVVPLRPGAVTSIAFDDIDALTVVASDPGHTLTIGTPDALVEVAGIRDATGLWTLTMLASRRTSGARIDLDLADPTAPSRSHVRRVS